jgi:hypothetical protein
MDLLRPNEGQRAAARVVIVGLPSRLNWSETLSFVWPDLQKVFEFAARIVSAASLESLRFSLIPRSYRVAYIANATSFTRNLLLAFLLCTPKGGLRCRYGLTGSASEDHQGDYGCEESKTKGHYQYYTHRVLA